MPTAITRPNYSGGGTDALAEWFTQQRRQNPSFQAPPGYEWKGDHFERDVNGPWSDIAKWTAILGAGTAAGVGGAGLAGFGPAAAGGIASGVPAGLPGAVPLSTVTGGGAAAGAGAAGAGAAGAGGALGALQKWAPLLGLGVSGLGMLGGRGEQDVPFQDELSGLLRLQRGRMEQANPLYDAILKMAMGLLPMSARSGLTGGQPPTGGGRG